VGGDRLTELVFLPIMEGLGGRILFSPSGSCELFLLTTLNLGEYMEFFYLLIVVYLNFYVEMQA
jgi:hypothetical protein